MAPPERGQVVGGRYPFTGAAIVTESGMDRKLSVSPVHNENAPAALNSAIVHGEPNSRTLGIGPGDAVATVRRDVNIIARPQNARLRLALERQAGRPRQNQPPFGPALVVPETGRARLPGGDDALDAQIVAGEKRNYLLGVETFGHRGEQISALANHGRSGGLIDGAAHAVDERLERIALRLGLRLHTLESLLRSEVRKILKIIRLCRGERRVGSVVERRILLRNR